MAEKKHIERLADESVPRTFVRVLGPPYLRTTSLRCVASIFRNFFFFQARASFLPGLIPVSKVDHPLDSRIPFLPAKVDIYIDFVAFWVRTVGYLLKTFGRRVYEPVRFFLETMGGLYALAAEVYRKNLSTTDRPFYIGRPRFLMIHTVDPHLMCVPSLHVMVVIRTYTFFEEVFKTIFDEKHCARYTEELRRGAIAITEAVLYVKQHSVNCIPAALYAMTRYDPGLFPQEEAERFVSKLFADKEKVKEADVAEIREYIISIYRRFMAQGQDEEDWTKPLLAFLNEHPRV